MTVCECLFLQAMRGRTFFLCYDPRDPSWQECLWHHVEKPWQSFCHQLKLQDHVPREFHHFMQKEWNSTAKIPMHLWLTERQGRPERTRLHQLGNCVVPPAARLAFEVLLQMKRQAQALET